ncbi:COG1470 family protein [Streptomyces xiamenensis]
MTVSASLDESPLSVSPGDEAGLPVRVLNSGTIVEEVRFEVVGPCAAWTTVEPETLSLYPGSTGTAVLRLRPPREPGITPGTVPLGLRVTHTSDDGRPQVPERSVTVEPYAEVTAELLPRGSQGRLRGRHRIAVDNRGNTPSTLDLTTQQSTDRVRPVFEPATLRIPPGQAQFATLKVKPAKRVWRGAAVTHPFQAVVSTAPAAAGEAAAAGSTDPPPAGAEPVVLDGVYEQQAIIPQWLPRALIAAVLIGALLTGLWFTVLRPTVQSAAREAVPDAVQEAVDEIDAARDGGLTEGQDGGPDAGAGGAGGGGGDPAGQGAGGADGGADGAGGGGGSPAAGEPGGPGLPTSARVEVRDGPGGGATTRSAYEVPSGMTFQLTDIVVQNPQGDAGDLTISSQGAPLLTLALENFRDTDYHFVTPIAVPAGEEITITLNCREVGRPVASSAPSECSEALFLSGTLTAPPES